MSNLYIKDATYKNRPKVHKNTIYRIEIQYKRYNIYKGTI